MSSMQRSSTRSIDWRRIIIEITLLVLIVAALFYATKVIFTPQNVGVPPKLGGVPSNSCVQPSIINSTNHIGVTRVSTSQSDTVGEYIGISDGSFDFDTQGLDKNEKCQAAQAFRANENQKAASLWTQALKKESNDAEAAIYQENQHILLLHLPYITFIVGVTLTGDNVNVGHDILQGVAVEQKEYNQSHPNDVQVRLLIANFGSQPANAATVINQITQATLADQTIKGMTGLPLSSVLQGVIGTLPTLSFPIVLPNGSNGPQENAQNIFHVAPSTSREGVVGAKYVEQNCPYVSSGGQTAFDCPGQNVDLFIDPGDTYSNSLGSAFQQQITKDGAKKTVTTIPYRAGDANDIKAKIQNALDTVPFPDEIYFAGTASDANTLLENLSSSGRYANLRVIGGDALYELGGYTAGAFRRLDFTAFSYPDEWGFLNLSQPLFFNDYAQDFAGGMVGYGYTRPENDVILSYDALAILLRGSELARATSGDQFLPRQLEDALTQIAGQQAFQGVSGRISFQTSDHNPDDKAIVILRSDEYGRVQLQGVAGTFR